MGTFSYEGYVFHIQKSLSDLGCKPPGVRGLVERTIGTFGYEGHVFHIQKSLSDLGGELQEVLRPGYKKDGNI
jgi:hypothetical protein